MRSRDIWKHSHHLFFIAIMILLSSCAHYQRPGLGYVETGTASWYGQDFHGKPTASGEPYNMYGVSAAHKTIPLGCRVRVTNLANGNQVVVPINDRGPFVGDRIIDMSYGAAKELGMVDCGLAKVRVEVLDMPRYYSGGRYTLQFGSFAEKENARKMVSLLESKGYNPNIEEATVYGNTVYRVRFGAFTTLDLAKSYERKCASQGITCFVIGL